MARTPSYPVQLRREHIADFCEKNHPVTFKEVLRYAAGKPLPAMPSVPSKQEHVIRADLHKLRQDGDIRPEWIVVKSNWSH